MTAERAPEPEEMAGECRAFSMYLTGFPPTPYVLDTYRRCHAGIPYLRGAPYDRVEAMLLGVARRGGLPLRCADAYARLFRPAGALRQKLVLALAVLENSPPTHLRLHAARQGAPATLVLVMLGRGVGFACCLLSALMVLGPAHLVLSLLPGRARG